MSEGPFLWFCADLRDGWGAQNDPLQTQLQTGTIISKWSLKSCPVIGLYVVRKPVSRQAGIPDDHSSSTGGP